MSDSHRLWFIRRDAKVQGPFPEVLICRFIALGRIGEADELSQDGSYWRKAGDVPELAAGVVMLLGSTETAGDIDPAWAEERSKAALRWLDDRKSPDPRARKKQQAVELPHPERRKESERRQNPETVEQHAYREGRGEYESWVRQQRQRYGRVALFVLAVLLLVALVAIFARPVNPIKVGLRLSGSDCDAAPLRGVNWSNCIKDDALLVGADLRAAELVGASLRHANLSYADLTGANLLHADLAGANLAGARLGGAVWLDGRVCAPDSVGFCK